MEVSNLSYENVSMFQLLHSLLHAAKGSNNFYSQISLHKIPGGFQYLLFKSCMKFKHYKKKKKDLPVETPEICTFSERSARALFPKIKHNE